jgi:CHAT domain-containing protein
VRTEAAQLVLRATVLYVTGHAADALAKRNYEQALQDYYTVLAIAVANSDELEIARTWRKIGQVFSRKNDLKVAVVYGEKALELSTRLADKQNIADASSALVGPYLYLGRLDEAEQAARRAQAGYTELGDRRRAVASSVNVATVVGEKGDQIQKAALLRELIRECEQAEFNDILSQAVNNLAVVYHDQGDFERSLQYLRRSLELLLRSPPVDPYLLSSGHSNIAVMLAALGRDKEALAEYAEAEEVAQKTNQPDQVMHVRSNRAALYRTTGSAAKALEEMRPVAAYYETSSIRIDALRSLGEYAQTLLAAGDARGAAEVGERCLREARTIGGPDILWLTLWPLGDAYLALKDPEKARAAFLGAISAVESIKLSGSEDERDNFFHQKTYPYQGMVSLLLQENRPFEALQYAERAKARLLVDVLRSGRSEISRALTDSEKQRERDLSSGVANIDAQLARAGATAPRELLAQRDNAILDLGNFRQALYQAHPGLQMHRAEFSPITTAQLSGLLPDSETVLLEYVFTRSAVHLFAISRHDDGNPKVESYTLRDSAGLPSLIEKFRSQLAARDLGYRATARSLYEKIAGPASVTIAKKKRIIVVPDGPLWNLPFQALLTPDGRHLLEQAALFYAPSLTAAFEMRNISHIGSASGHTLLALGGPVSQMGGLPSLPESIREVRRIGEMYGTQNSAVLTGNRAGKDRWKAAAPDYRILHLATHGVLNANNPLYSYLVMSAPPGARDESVLTAREILALDLQAELAVLSACETARGRFRFGEGLIGMSWAFLVAGTPTAVVSQWKVDSASTSQLMLAFHRNLKPAETRPLTARAEALRSAVLELLRTPGYSHPYYWAGFVMIGNGY